MTKKWIQILAGCLGAMVLGLGTAFGSAGTHFGQLVLPKGAAAPAPGEVTFVAFLNGDDSVIHTHNAYNSALGQGNGYVTQGKEGFWFVNFSNFAGAQAGSPYSVVLTTKDNLRATFNGNVPSSTEEAPFTLEMKRVAVPTAPTSVNAQRSGDRVSLTWRAEGRQSYRIYRSALPSGAANDASNGIYTKIAQNVTGGSFVDTTAEAGKTYWYVVIAQDKRGVLSAPSSEVAVKPVQANNFRAIQAGNVGKLGLATTREELQVIGETTPPRR